VEGAGATIVMIMASNRCRQADRIAFLVLFGPTIPTANCLIGHVGTACAPHGPCLMPVVPGSMARSGVMMIGFALVLRDLVQRRFGVGVALATIFAGCVFSASLVPSVLVFALATAFLLSELADFAVYTPLARHRLAAVVASSLWGVVIDSVPDSLRYARLSARSGRSAGSGRRQRPDGLAVNSFRGLAAASR
jgi:queuosine precursor transporter